MENPSSSREKGFCFPDVPTEEMDGWVKNLISEEDMFSSSSSSSISELMNFESFASWCNTPAAADVLFTQYGLTTSQSTTPTPFGGFTTLHVDPSRALHGLEGCYVGEKRPAQEMMSQFYCLSDTGKMTGKRSKSGNLTGAKEYSVPRSLSHSLDERMLKALSLFMDFSGEGILAQFWTPVKTGDQYMLSTCDQAYLLDSRLSGYREVSRQFTFSAETSQYSSPGLPGRVFISGVPEWTSNVMYYKTAEYLRMKHALDNNVRGSIAIPVLEASESSCCAVLELVTCREKPNFDLEMDSVCRALQAVNLQTSTIPRRQYLSTNQKEALAEIRDVLRAVCHAHRLPLALLWIPCSYSKGANDELVKVYGKKSDESYLLCIEETACYVNDMEMEGFVNACLEHYLREGQGIAGRALISNKPSFSSDVKTFDICEYPLVQHARKFGLNAAVATKLRSTFTGDNDYILEFFLPVNMKGSSEQQLLLDSLSGTMQRICRTLRTVSDEVSEVGVRSGEIISNLLQATVSEGSFQTTLLDTDVNSTRSIFSNIISDKSNDLASSQGTLQQKISGARRSEKKKSSTEKNVSLNVLQQYFSGSLKDAAKSLGVCPTTLKRICRQHGIMRWPSRKINKVNRSLKKIQTVLDSVQGVEGGLKFDSVTGEFVAVGPFIQEFGTQKSLPSHHDDAFVRSQCDMDEDASLELLKVKSHDDGEVKLEEGIETNQAGPAVCSGSVMEPWDWISKQSGLNYSDDFDIGKRSEELNKDKDLCVRRCLSSLALADDGKISRIERGSGIAEPNRSMSSSLSDSSNGSGAVVVGSSSNSMEQEWSQTFRTHNSSGESGSLVTVKATYRDDTIRFKLDPCAVGCSQLYKEVAKRFKLQEGAFQLKYLDDEEEWVMLVTDSDLQECLEIFNGMRKHTLKFLVRDLPGAAMGSSAGSNGYLGTGL